MKTCMPLPLLILLLGALAPISPVAAQLRPDPKALEVAKTMVAKRASATDVAGELRTMRQSAAQATAVLHAVGYTPAQIAGAHERAYRLDVNGAARAWMEGVSDAGLAFAALTAMRRESGELARAAREELRMSARDAMRQMERTRAIEKTQTERAYAEMKAGGFATRAVVQAMAGTMGSTPSQVFDAMLAAGASLGEIAQELAGALGQSTQQVRELFEAKGVDTTTGAAALDAIGASATEVLFFVFREAIAGQQQDRAYFEERAQIAAGYAASGADAVGRLSGKISDLGLAVLGFGIDVAQEGGALTAATVSRIQATALVLSSAGIDAAEWLGALQALGATSKMIGRVAFAVAGNADAAWTLLRDGLGWSADQIHGALSEIVPITIGYLANLVALGGTAEKVKEVVARLRDLGVSAVSIAAEVGAELGLVPMAHALWDAGYGATEVTAGLVQGMQATAQEAASVVAGLAGGGPL